jgi:hypothetical protein
MGSKLTMTNKQTTTIGPAPLDEDGQVVTTLPSGATMTYESSNPDVAGVVLLEDGFHADVTSGQNGTAIITGTGHGFDPELPPDTMEVTVTNSKVKSLNLTAGEPRDE